MNCAYHQDLLIKGYPQDTFCDWVSLLQKKKVTSTHAVCEDPVIKVECLDTLCDEAVFIGKKKIGAILRAYHEDLVIKGSSQDTLCDEAVLALFLATHRCAEQQEKILAGNGSGESSFSRCVVTCVIMCVCMYAA